jgi:hypothetical protein
MRSKEIKIKIRGIVNIFLMRNFMIDSKIIMKSQVSIYFQFKNFFEFIRKIIYINICYLKN